MRLFIGVPLPEDVKDLLVNAQKKISMLDNRLTLVKRDNLHITLYFIGESNSSNINLNVNYKSFKAALNGISFFKHNNVVRIIYSPVISDELIALHDLITKQLGVNESFIPHVTLARVKFVKDTRKLEEFCSKLNINAEFIVDKVNIYSSKLTPNGPIYNIVKSFEL